MNIFTIPISFLWFKPKRENIPIEFVSGHKALTIIIARSVDRIVRNVTNEFR